MSNYIAMWVSDWKADEYRWLKTTKARLVEREHEQRVNSDLGELFAPTCCCFESSVISYERI